MIAELGLFCLVVGLLFAGLLAVIPAIGVWKNNLSFQQVAVPYVIGQCIFVIIAYSCLTVSFLQDDFTVIYVLTNSSTLLPWFYKLCAVWGGHEGSMLLWVLILSLWMLAVAVFSLTLDISMRARVLSVLGLLSVGFILFILITSNPFARQFQVFDIAGRDLNPLLQDPGFLFHPPMLYMGYVGFSVAFAFAIAGLWAGNIEASWARWTRPWTLAAWCCLTAGITLGSWWAYRELGWGGWWFWDPVENASFMPWLVGTALIHSLAVCEKRLQFKAWTVLLAISAFSLSLIGTFLVRSGVLTSVHAFAVDPQRGLYILWFLMIVIGGSFLLFFLRGHILYIERQSYLVSRESALLLNNVFLAVMMLTVLLGTIYPLLIDALNLGKLSVGAPYFNSVMVPLALPFLCLMGFGIHLRWQQDTCKRLLAKLKVILIISVLLTCLILGTVAHVFNVNFILAVLLSLWILASTIFALFQKLKHKGHRRLSPAFLGMILAHCGVAVTVLGIAISTQFGVQDDVKMRPGEETNLANYQIKFLAEAPLSGPNYHGTRASFNVTYRHYQSTIYPEKRIYDIGQMAMTESAIDVSPFRDIYIALGEPLDDASWSVRLYYKPFVRWIWAGGFIMLLGGIMAMADRRYYVQKKQIISALEVQA